MEPYADTIRDSRSIRLLTRREVVAAAVSLCGCSAALPAAVSVTDELSAIRSRIGGRLGVHALDTQTGWTSPLSAQRMRRLRPSWHKISWRIERSRSGTLSACAIVFETQHPQYDP